ncbi:MAG: adenylate/guanylate cyclase domain-containing protein [Myxococcota bacterium]
MRLPGGSGLRCPSCERQNSKGSAFCLGCGTPLARDCTACGQALPPDAAFCNACGRPLGVVARPQPPHTLPPRDPRTYTPKHLTEKILQSKSALEGERKQVTVLFADVKGSMELAERVDPEEWHRILDGFFQILTDGVHRFEGTVNQYLGDGIMALFGAPIAHEDHDRRACYAALYLLRELRDYGQELRREGGLDFAVRIGLHSGDVVVGKIGDDLRMDYTAQGHTVGLAARMQELAEAGRAYITHTTAERVRGYFELEELGAFRVKGAEESICAFALLAPGTVRSRFDFSLARGLTRFVGRGEDLGVLTTALERTLRGNGQVVGVVAEAGTGKTRLCYEFLERCRARGDVFVVEGRAVAHGKNIPLLPILEVIRGYYGISEHDDDRSAREKIAGRMLLLDEAFRDVLPLLFDFLGVADPERPAPRLDPEGRKRQLFGVLRKLLQGDERRSSLVLIEDLHWIDGASETWLNEWVDAVVGTNNLLLVNFRPEYHAAWMQRSHYQQLALAPLGPEAIHELLSDLLGHDPSLEGLGDAIHERTAGNPFFIEEVVQSLVESGTLEGTRGSYRLLTPIGTLSVPDSVQAVLAARIDRLAEREKRVLQTAAVIGKDFSESILKVVAGLPALELHDTLAALRAAEFVYETALYPVAEYAFKHPLTQSVALHSQLHERRRRTHAEVACALEAACADRLDERAALLAHHWEEAGEALPAARWHRRAAEWAGPNDVSQATHHWDSVRALLSHREEELEVARLLAVACQHLLHMGWRAGTTEERAREVFESGRRHAQRSGDVATEARTEGAYGAVQTLQGNLGGGQNHIGEFERLAIASKDEELAIIARGWGGYVRFLRGELDSAAMDYRAVLELTRDRLDLGVDFLGSSAHAFFLALLIGVEGRVSSLPLVDDLLSRGLRVSRQRGELENEAFLLHWASEIVIRFVGDVERGCLLAQEGLEKGERVGSPLLCILGSTGLSLGLAADARYAEAETLLDGAFRMMEEHRTNLEEMPALVALRAELRLGEGDSEGALGHARSALARAEELRTGIYRPECERALAHALTARGELGEAEAALVRAAAQAEKMGVRNYRPLLHMDRAAIIRRGGDGSAATHELREALRLFEAIGALGHVRRVRAELAETVS